MPDIKGSERIVLRPNDNYVPYFFEFEPCSTASLNDGAIPYGTNIASIGVTAEDQDGTDATAEMIKGASLSSNVVTVYLKYPATLTNGTYDLTFSATLDNSVRTRLDNEFNRRIDAVEKL